MAKLGEVCLLKAGKFVSANDISPEYNKGLYPCFGGNGIRGYVADYTHDGEFPLIGRQGALCGNVNLASGKFHATEHAVVVQPKIEMNVHWLYYALNAMNLGQYATGAAQPGLAVSKLETLSIEIPNISEQNKIAQTLCKVEQLVNFRKQQLAKLDELVKARFVEMFGNIIRNDKSWPIHNFSDIASSRLGKMLDAKQQTGKYSYPYLANFNVQWFNFNVDNLNQMDFNEAEQKEFELRDGDLLVCEGGEIGRCAVWHNEIQPCFFQKALHRVRCNRQLVQPDYLAWWFKYNCNHGGFAEIAGAKATIAHLPGIKLKQLQVALPPLSLQNEFAAFVERVDQQKQTVQQSLEKLELMKKALMQEYFG